MRHAIVHRERTRDFARRDVGLLPRGNQEQHDRQREEHLAHEGDRTVFLQESKWQQLREKTLTKNKKHFETQMSRNLTRTPYRRRDGAFADW